MHLLSPRAKSKKEKLVVSSNKKVKADSKILVPKNEISLKRQELSTLSIFYKECKKKKAQVRTQEAVDNEI